MTIKKVPQNRLWLFWGLSIAIAGILAFKITQENQKSKRGRQPRQVNYEAYYDLKPGEFIEVDMSLYRGQTLLKIESTGSAILNYEWSQPHYNPPSRYLSPWLKSWTKKDPPPPMLLEKRLNIKPGLHYYYIGTATARRTRITTVASRKDTVRIHLKALMKTGQENITFWTRPRPAAMSSGHRAGFGSPNSEWYPGQRPTWDSNSYLGKWYETDVWIDKDDLFTYDLQSIVSCERIKNPRGIYFAVKSLKGKFQKLPNKKRTLPATIEGEGRLYQLPVGQLCVMTTKWLDSNCLQMTVFRSRVISYQGVKSIKVSPFPWDE